MDITFTGVFSVFRAANCFQTPIGVKKALSVLKNLRKIIKLGKKPETILKMSR
jgi:hypothetical protein